MARKPRILLLGGDADHNVGDRAIVTALAHCIATEYPSAEVALVGNSFSSHAIPGITRIIHRGPRGIGSLARCALRADRILVAGGGLFQDDDSRAKMPYWAARLALLRMLNSRIVGHSIGAGPLSHRESRVSARIACMAMKRVTVRDRFARDTLAPCTSRAIEIVPDPAFMLEPAPPQAAISFLERLEWQPDRPIIVATVRRWFHARGSFVPNAVKLNAGFALPRNEARFEALLDAVGHCLVHVARKLDAGILLLPGYNVAHEADDVACEALMRRLADVPARLARIPDPGLYKAVLGRASLIVASRMHPLVMGAGMGVPIVGLSYNPKFDGLFELLGLEARSLPLDRFPDLWAAPELLAAAEAAMERQAGLGQRADALATLTRRQALTAAFGELDGKAHG
ncbi:MAG: polysaccharide pyruvyl transferase family protein [Steroidobacteraceae bacterium]